MVGRVGCRGIRFGRGDRGARLPPAAANPYTSEFYPGLPAAPRDEDCGPCTGKEMVRSTTTVRTRGAATPDRNAIGGGRSGDRAPAVVAVVAARAVGREALARDPLRGSSPRSYAYFRAAARAACHSSDDLRGAGAAFEPWHTVQHVERESIQVEFVQVQHVERRRRECLSR